MLDSLRRQGIALVALIVVSAVAALLGPHHVLFREAAPRPGA